MEEALQEDGLTTAQANVLTELAYGPARSNAELARTNFVTPQTMNEILLSLERAGLVIRTPHPEGGRAMLTQLTKEGSRKVLAVHLAMRQVEEGFLSALSAEDVSRTRQLLEKCLKALDKQETEIEGVF
jgi:DNA-binding MarR family transcriptional regulator